MPSTVTDRLNGLTTSVAVKPPCVAVASTNITLAGLQTIDAVTVVTGDRVLLIGQTDSTQNGIYIADSGDWTRSKDFDGARDAVQGTLVLVRNQFIEGAFYELTTANTVVFGTSSITFRLRDSPNITYDLTLAEIAAGVTPTNYAYQELDPERYGPAWTTTTDYTATINTALSVAVQGLGFVQLRRSVYQINGTVTVPAGVTLRGLSSASEYFPGGPGSSSYGSLMYKTNPAGSAGPLIVLNSGSGLDSIYLKHENVNGATTGILRIGDTTANNSFYNWHINNVRIYGAATTDVSGTNTCYGIFMPRRSTSGGGQSYFGRASNCYITNCDVALRLNENCNANIFNGIVIRQCYYPIEIDGDATALNCVENVFTGLALQNIGVLATTPSIVFVLRNGANNNVFSGYSTECNGTAFSIGAGCLGNQFIGHENEVTASFVPDGNVHSPYAQPINPTRKSQLLLTSGSAGLRNINGLGNCVRFCESVTGTLPDLNGAGALVAANANCKTFLRFNAIVAKGNKPCMFFRFRVSLEAPGGGVGKGLVEVRGFYRQTDNATFAGSLSVLEVFSKPAANYIAGLFFLTGVNAVTSFGLAITGGNVGAVTATQLLIEAEIFFATFAGNSVAMESFADVTIGTAASTANDVLDAISLLAVADTAV